MQTIIQKTYIQGQLVKALPFPLDTDANGEIRIKIHSDKGETNWLTISPEIMRKIEFYLLAKEVGENV